MTLKVLDNWIFSLPLVFQLFNVYAMSQKHDAQMRGLQCFDKYEKHIA